MTAKSISIKNILLICLLLASSVLLGSCEKDANNGLVEFSVMYDGQPVTSATIHAKSGILTDPDIPVEQYDRHIRVDAYSEYWYKDVPPGDYFFLAIATVNGVSVSGTASLHVDETARHNKYEVVIVLE